MGIKYEKDLAKALPKAVRGQWFKYVRQDGIKTESRHCQTDFIVEWQNFVVILELKLTNWGEALDKLLNLYLPVAKVTFPGKKIVPVIVLRHLTNVPKSEKVYDDLREAIIAAESKGTPVVFHWLGKGPVTKGPLE